jgi:hypothetical protein
MDGSNANPECVAAKTFATGFRSWLTEYHQELDLELEVDEST